MTFDHARHVGLGFGAGLATVWNDAADWGEKLLFAVVVGVLATQADHVIHYFVKRLFKKGK